MNMIMGTIVSVTMIFVALQLQAGLIEVAKSNKTDVMPLYSASTILVLAAPLEFLGAAPLYIGGRIAMLTYIVGIVLLTLFVWIARFQVKELITVTVAYFVAVLIGSLYMFHGSGELMPVIITIAICSIIVAIRAYKFSKASSEGQEEEDSDYLDPSDEDDEGMSKTATLSWVLTVFLFIVFLVVCWFLLKQLGII